MIGRAFMAGTTLALYMTSPLTARAQSGDDVDVDVDARTYEGERYDEERTYYRETDADEDRMITDWGLGLTIGGGAGRFTSDAVNDQTDVAGNWTARLIFGTRQALALELGYIGAASGIEAPDLDTNAVLMANGAEGIARVHVVRLPLDDEGDIVLKPYVLAGVAWKHYRLMNADFNTSNVRDSDNVAEFPVGAGLAWRFGRILAEQRFEFRPAASDTMFGGDDPVGGMHNWSATARAGFEF